MRTSQLDASSGCTAGSRRRSTDTAASTWRLSSSNGQPAASCRPPRTWRTFVGSSARSMTSESSCGPSVPALEYANRLTALVLGTDAYYRSVGAARGRARDGLGLPVGLVAMHWSDVAPEPVDSWESANVQLLALGEEAAQLPGAYERDWYGELCASLRLLFRWYQGEALSLEEIVEHGHRSRFNAPSERLLEHLCLTRDEAVRAAGYESYADYLDENALQADEVVPRLTALVAEAA